MSKSQVLLWLTFLLVLLPLLRLSRADIGTASRFSPPYIRKCNHNIGFDFSTVSQNLLKESLDAAQQILWYNRGCIGDKNHDFFSATACYGSDVSQFPTSNLFAAAGEDIWDNGAACGRQYNVRCLSADVPQTCVVGKTIRVKIVDRAARTVSKPSKAGATFVLSDTAFSAIANPSVPLINLEFQQV